MHIKYGDRIKKILGPSIIKFIKYNIPGLSAKRSYSQCGEDLLIDSFLKHKETGFYVDIGANDHIDLSNTYKFYSRGWTGIQIEPNYKNIKHFKKYRPNTISLNIGVGNKKNTKFFIFESSVLSTFSEEEAKKHENLGHKIIETTNVQILPLKDIFKEHLNNKHIDFMSIDTEGYDLEVLKTNDWVLYRPSFIIVETAEYVGKRFGQKLNEIYDHYMEGIGYEKVADTFVNTIYRDKNNKLIDW